MTVQKGRFPAEQLTHADLEDFFQNEKENDESAAATSKIPAFEGGGIEAVDEIRLFADAASVTADDVIEATDGLPEVIGLARRANSSRHTTRNMTGCSRSFRCHIHAGSKLDQYIGVPVYHLAQRVTLTRRITRTEPAAHEI